MYWLLRMDIRVLIGKYELEFEELIFVGRCERSMKGMRPGLGVLVEVLRFCFSWVKKAHHSPRGFF